MVLLLQLNAELPEHFPSHERRLYVFACRRPACRRKDGSVRALRGVRWWRQQEEDPATSQIELGGSKSGTEAQMRPSNSSLSLGETLFGGKPLAATPSPANPFSINADVLAPHTPSPNPFGTAASSAAPAPVSKPPPQKQSATGLAETFAETLSLNTPLMGPPPPPEPWPEATIQPEPYPCLYLSDAEYETLDPTPAKVPEHARMEAEDAPEPSALDREAFESSMDSTFQAFADRMAQNPEQVIRYDFGGTPLLYSKTDAVGLMLAAGRMPACAHCGQPRTFEVQLTPNAIAELEADDMSLEGMEWGTILVAVCQADCLPRGTAVGGTGYVDEWVGVQWEELARKR